MIPSSGCPPWPPDHPRTLPRTGAPTPHPGTRPARGWPLIDRTGLLDLDGVRELARIGREEGIAQIWDLMHYGYPDDLDPFTPAFRERFVAYARAVAQSSARRPRDRSRSRRSTRSRIIPGRGATSATWRPSAMAGAAS